MVQRGQSTAHAAVERRHAFFRFLTCIEGDGRTRPLVWGATDQMFDLQSRLQEAGAFHTEQRKVGFQQKIVKKKKADKKPATDLASGERKIEI